MVRNLSILILLMISVVELRSQSNINPDISLIGKFNTFTNFIKGTPEYGKLNFESPSMELFIDGYLNPFARATANIAYEGGEFGVEELYGNIVRGLPLDMQIKAGKFLVGFGKINTIHPHAWAFLERPLYQQVFFGEEGMNDVGMNFSFLLPTGEVYTNLDLGVFKGASFPVLSDTNAVNRGINPIFVGRLGTFFSLNDYSNLEIGLSGSYGVYSKGGLNLLGDISTGFDEKPFHYFYAGLDFKYKYVPDSYTALTIQGEGIVNYRDVIREGEFGINRNCDQIKKISNSGAFVYVDYKFLKQFSIGIKYDYTAGIVGSDPSFYSLSNDDKNSTQGFETWFSFYPVEETSVVRLGIQHLVFNYTDGANRDGETTVKLQFMFSLGPHKAHPF
jgi:hypothetical protein